ncbi:hypothetical protein PUW95_03445 [Metamycoplasma hyosynoviae]|uniref:hypothetical protein n=1 Tax=Metamycoplasma hyosynoviae TaxID=29559 RepID=UPI0023664440|nr:hypothetical protein [Metamycoplasma hyosynoviae]MDD7897769.1 hypothetical protein [Metamycoplasma hyosynoviae]
MNYDIPIEHKIEVKGKKIKFLTKKDLEERKIRLLEDFKKKVAKNKDNYQKLMSYLKFVLELAYFEDGYIKLNWKKYSPQNDKKIRPDFFDRTIRSIDKHTKSEENDSKIKWTGELDWLEGFESYKSWGGYIPSSLWNHPIIVKRSLVYIIPSFAKNIYFYNEKYYVGGIGELVRTLEDYFSLKNMWAKATKRSDNLYFEYLKTVFEAVREFRNNYLKFAIRKVPGRQIHYESVDDRIVIDKQSGQIILLKNDI